MPPCLMDKQGSSDTDLMFQFCLPNRESRKRRYNNKYLPKNIMVIKVKTEGDIIVNDRDIWKCKGSLDAMKIIEKILRNNSKLLKIIFPSKGQRELVNPWFISL